MSILTLLFSSLVVFSVYRVCMDDESLTTSSHSSPLLPLYLKISELGQDLSRFQFLGPFPCGEHTLSVLLDVQKEQFFLYDVESCDIIYSAVVPALEWVFPCDIFDVFDASRLFLLYGNVRHRTAIVSLFFDENFKLLQSSTASFDMSSILHGPLALRPSLVNIKKFQMLSESDFFLLYRDDALGCVVLFLRRDESNASIMNLTCTESERDLCYQHFISSKACIKIKQVGFRRHLLVSLSLFEKGKYTLLSKSETPLSGSFDNIQFFACNYVQVGSGPFRGCGPLICLTMLFKVNSSCGCFRDFYLTSEASPLERFHSFYGSLQPDCSFDVLPVSLFNSFYLSTDYDCPIVCYNKQSKHTCHISYAYQNLMLKSSRNHVIPVLQFCNVAAGKILNCGLENGGKAIEESLIRIRILYFSHFLNGHNKLSIWPPIADSDVRPLRDTLLHHIIERLLVSTSITQLFGQQPPLYLACFKHQATSVADFQTTCIQCFRERILPLLNDYFRNADVGYDDIYLSRILSRYLERLLDNLCATMVESPLKAP